MWIDKNSAYTRVRPDVPCLELEFRNVMLHKTRKVTLMEGGKETAYLTKQINVECFITLDW
jgi:hypothetical protein